MWTRTAGLPDCSEPGMGMLSPQVRRTSVLRSKTLAQGEFISPEHFNPNGSPQNARILWADDKQLDELSLAVTRREEASDEE